MLVKDWMTTKVISVDEETSLTAANRLMKDNSIRRLPVVRQGQVVGLVTDRDIRTASPSQATSLDFHELLYLLSQIKVKDIMTRNVFTILPDDTIELAAAVMGEHHFSGLPVVDAGGELVGILSMNDVFRALINITGIYEGGTQFGFMLADRAGSIKEVTDVIRERGFHVISILSKLDESAEGMRKVFIRISDAPLESVEALTKELKERFEMLYVHQDQLSRIRKA